MAIVKNKSLLYGDATVIRLVAAQVFVIAIVTLFTHSVLLIAFLLVDFAIRAFSNQPSVLKWLAQKITTRLSVSPKPIFLPPKKFAALLGFIFTAIWLVFLIFGRPDLALVVGVVLLICAFLEAVFQVCVGCYVYNWVVAPWLRQSNK
ncbi:DUF4395 domain-containing protein [Sphingobacterium sp. lm-10]|uniref:DUF4395 domain-containing protein n=1 Tax=Sphingobacterium sp. lm-10 TaxID=2944904 RepID=UPI00201FBC9C|nr:DUF4395 domain-containing protein [Sphingobacterium sp. lm-10]MCL7987257.1 DUF4395 domain-containing protein [Sphingobacterium sp. lm-10]